MQAASRPGEELWYLKFVLLSFISLFSWCFFFSFLFFFLSYLPCFLFFFASLLLS
jgi:hypothetical protein